MANELINIENTRFIFATNFEGNPDKDKYRSPARKGNIVLTPEQARDLGSRGFNVKQTKPKPEEEEGFETTFFIPIIVRFGDKENLWPRIYLVSGDSEPVKLGPDTIGMIDDLWVENVDVTCGAHEYEPGKSTLYVRVMYVTQRLDEDCYAEKYRRHDDNPF